MHKPLLAYLLGMLLCSAGSQLYSQSLSERTEQLREKVSYYTYDNKPDSARIIINEFLETPGLNPLEIFYGHYQFAAVVQSSSEPEDAVRMLLRCKDLLKDVPDSSKYLSLIYGNIAESYFNVMNYDSAKYYALRSIEAEPDSSLRSAGHAINYMIIGYSDFVADRYESALAQYNLAMIAYTEAGETCELPLCLLKIARVNNAMGQTEASKRYIEHAIQLSDSCGIEQYALLAKRTQYEIYRENGDYKSALAKLEEINDLVARMENSKHDKALSELSVKYETQMVEQENTQLKTINQKNEEYLASQKLALWILASAIIILGGLLILIVSISKKRKRAEMKLSVLNSQLEEQVAERTQHLTEANRSIRENTDLLIFQNKQLVDFCNIISHNLRSPMRNVSVLVDFIETTNSEEKKKEFLGKLKPVIGSMNQTFDELLESLKVRQELDIKSDRIRFADCLARVMQDLSIEIHETGAEITGDFSRAPEVLFPRKYLNSILHNLISNAIKYRSPGKHPVIRLSSERVVDRVILTVCDNGLGIDLDKFGDKIFKIGKIFHEHPNAKGFGLFITKTQVEAMKGNIRVESVPGKGTCFYVEFVRPE